MDANGKGTQALRSQSGGCVVSESSPLTTIAEAIGSTDFPISQRMRALFLARHKGGDAAVEALLGGLKNNSSGSVLLRHEIAYVLGQLGNTAAIDALSELLDNPKEDDMVRHEAAEALAAMGSKESMELLERHAKDPSAPVRETCELALISLQSSERSEAGLPAIAASTAASSAASTTFPSTTTTHQEADSCPTRRNGPFNTVDPIPPNSQISTTADVDELEKILLNSSAPLRKRYEALFGLRNTSTNRASQIISEALVTDKGSALLRHEVAFVLGQLQSTLSIDALTACLSNASEHRMARHEAALAIGAVVCGNLTSCDGSAEPVASKHSASVERRDLITKAISTLRHYSSDVEPVVSESCTVALDNIQQEIGGCDL